MDSKSYAKIFRAILIIIGVFMAFSAIILLPDLADHSASIYKEGESIAQAIIYFVWVSAIPFYLVLYEVIKICNYIIKDEIFTIGPIKALNNVALLSIIILLMYLVLLIILYFLNFFPPTMVLVLSVVIFASMSIALISKIMKILLARAIELKEENDFTI